MTRLIKVAAAQVGAVHRGADRKETTARLIKLLEDGAAQGAQLVVFPETALTTFFPRWQLESDELASYFDGGVESPHIQVRARWLWRGRALTFHRAAAHPARQRAGR